MSLDSKLALFNLKTLPERRNKSFEINTFVDFSDDSVTGSKKAVKPFTIFIGEPGKEEEFASITLLINPSNLTLSSSHLVDNKYTRNGWIVNMWGRQQSVMIADGSTAAFYTFPSGLTRKFRKRSASYLNYSALLSFFKNNGWNFVVDQNLSIRKMRAINVIDTVKVSYDGTVYEGSFSTMTFDEDAENPFRFHYSFEFVISGLLGDTIEGHISNINNRTKLAFGVQNSDLSFVTVVKQDEVQLNSDLKNGVSLKEIDGVVGLGKIGKLESSALASLEKTAFILGIPVEWLAAAINFETAGTWDPQKKNPNSSARGLIQFLDSTAKGLGYENSLDLVTKNSTIQAQLEGPVLQYLQPLGPFRNEDLQFFIFSIFLPKYRRSPLDTVIYNDDLSKQVEFRKANPGIITVGDYYNKLKKAFKQAENTIPSDLQV